MAVGALLGALGALLGRFWDALELSRDALGLSWDALGRSRDALGRSWQALGLIFDLPERFGRDFVASESRFWSLQGSILKPPGIDFATPIFERGRSITALTLNLRVLQASDPPTLQASKKTSGSAECAKRLEYM